MRFSRRTDCGENRHFVSGSDGATGGADKNDSEDEELALDWMWLLESTRLAVFHDGNTELDGDNSEESSTGPTSSELLHRAGMVQLQEFEEDERADSSDDDLSFIGSGVSQLWLLGIAGSFLDESHDDELSPVELSLSECQICFEYTLIEHRSCCDFKVCHECFN